MITHGEDLTAYKVVELEFTTAKGAGDEVHGVLERNLPERVWQNTGLSWNTETGRFTITVFEPGLEHRAGIIRCLNDMGFTPMETLLWI